jgi:hypothetical protein
VTKGLFSNIKTSSHTRMLIRSIGLPIPCIHTSPLRAQQVNALYRFVTITVLDIIVCPVFYLKHDVSCRCLEQRNVNKTYRRVRTSPETHYVSATSPTGYCYL